MAPTILKRAGRLGQRIALAAAVAVLIATPGAIGAECVGDECQPPTPPPEDPTPATAVVEGPGNPPVRFPQSKPRKKRHHQGQHRRGGR